MALSDSKYCDENGGDEWKQVEMLNDTKDKVAESSREVRVLINGWKGSFRSRRLDCRDMSPSQTITRLIIRGGGTERQIDVWVRSRRGEAGGQTRQ